MNALRSISLAAALTVPPAVKTALHQKYPVIHAKITWEKEKGNYEANWGGKSGEDTSVMFTPEGAFLEQVLAIAPTALPASVRTYVTQHYRGAKITEAGRVTDAKGATLYEAEIKGKDLRFDASGRCLGSD
jgi:hypothetical protein